MGWMYVRNRIKKLREMFTGSLSTKLTVIFLAVTVMPLFISSFVTYNNSVSTLRDEYIKSNLKVIQQGSKNIENYFESLNQLSLTPYSNREFMRNTSFDPSDFSGTQSNEYFLKNMLFSREDVVYLYYYITKSNVLYSFSKQIYADHAYPQLMSEPWFKKTMTSSTGVYLAPAGKFVNYKNIGDANASDVISMNRTIKNISTKDVLGVLSIVIDNKRLGQLCDSIASEHEAVALSNVEGDAFYSNLGSGLSVKTLLLGEKIRNKNDGYYTLMIGSEKNIVIFSKTFNGMILSKAIPYRLLESNAKKSLKASLIIILAAFIVVLCLSVFISYSITLPVKRLAKTMKSFGEGDFDVDISHKSNDEIGLLTDKFNEMTARIKSLINSEYKSKIAKKNAQLRALQAQINPHFIYNALQSIGTLALRKEAQDIYALANAIANMLRYSLKSANDMVPLYMEVDNMNNYLYVQKIRFSGRLTVNIDIDKNVREFMVPRLILQPLIENSIKYGIDDEKPVEDIAIHAVCEDEFLSVTVKDTGRGIDGNRLDMIKEWLEQEDDYLGDGEHLGIKNVLNRIKLIYGEKAAMTIESQAGKGTCITIRMPVNYEG